MPDNSAPRFTGTGVEIYHLGKSGEFDLYELRAPRSDDGEEGPPPIHLFVNGEGLTMVRFPGAWTDVWVHPPDVGPPVVEVTIPMTVSVPQPPVVYMEGQRQPRRSVARRNSDGSVTIESSTTRS